MDNKWVEKDVAQLVQAFAEKGYNEEISKCVYSTRLIGSDPELVLHGGGNTSVKGKQFDIFEKKIPVLCVKGSGWDMASIEPEGLPAVRLNPIKYLANLDKLSDEDMVNFLKTNLIESNSPTPSVETLSHAFLPFKYVNHSHASAVLTITNQPNGKMICRDVFGKKFGIVPYIMPGFDLAKKSIEIYLENPDVQGLILINHGIFTFSDDAETAYSTMIDSVTEIEVFINKTNRRFFSTNDIRIKDVNPSNLAPVLRGVLGEMIQVSNPQSDNTRFVTTFRTSNLIKSYVNGPELERYSQQGVTTPDHVIRTKNLPLILHVKDNSLLNLREYVRDTLNHYVDKYNIYFRTQSEIKNVNKTKLDPLPRVVLVPGVGIFGVGRNYNEASIAADIAENTIQTITDAETIGTYSTLSDTDIFDVEYWSLEQAKLKPSSKSLEGNIVVITGGAGTIGMATAMAFRHEGAEIVIVDINESDKERVLNTLGDETMFVQCDVTDQTDVNRIFEKICRHFGGIDILVSNAGRIFQGLMNDLEIDVLRESFELNFFSHQNVSQKAINIMRNQCTGGVLLFNVSKQSVNPGKGMGPYGLPKAATLSLLRQLAIENGEYGIKVNGVNADRIRSGLLTDRVIRTRALARGISEEEYMSGNLLKTEVYAEDVAQAFVQLALLKKTTAGITTVDGGNIEAALR